MVWTTVSAETKESKVVCRVSMACFYGTADLKALLCVGPEQQCKAIFAALNTNTALMKVGSSSYISKCPFHYTRKHIPMPCKWCGMLILSKDPRCLWNDEAPSLIATLKKVTETPFLDEWEPYLRMRLMADNKLVSFNGKNPQGSFLNCSTEELDAIVVDGIKSKQLHLQGMAA